MNSVDPQTSLEQASLEQTVLEQTVLEQAQALFEQTLVTAQGKIVGAIAALAPAGLQGELNYGEVFIRDNVPVMVYLLLTGRAETVQHFLTTCFQLQQQAGPQIGIFPTSFLEEDGVLIADYGQRAIGRVASVDASLWVPILAQMYVEQTGDWDWARSPLIQQGLHQLLQLLLAPRFQAAPTLWVPDGAFMIDRPLGLGGAPLEVQVLLYGALRSAGRLLGPGEEGGAAAIAHAQELRDFLRQHYWIDRKTIQQLRQQPNEQYGETATNPYNIYAGTLPDWLQTWLGTAGGYLVANVQTGQLDCRFLTLGNSLACLFDILEPVQQTALFQLILQNRADLVAEMPLRICHPPLTGLSWQRLTGCDPKNSPGSYHNGGHWPCLTWFLAIAILRQRAYLTQTPTLQQELTQLLDDCYHCQLRQLPPQQWAEYFDGPTGLWTGQQTRSFQTWTLVGLLLLHHVLKLGPGINPRDDRICASMAEALWYL